MSTFQHQLPEQEAAVAPPALLGQTITPTKLHGLRLRQLIDLAVAFDVKLPAGSPTKAQILPFMIAAEQAGVFRGRPVSQYHLLHAQLSHDLKLPDHEKDALVQQLTKAEFREFPPVEVAEKRTPNSYWGLHARAKKLGLEPAGRKLADLKAVVEEAENAAKSSVP